MSLVVGPLHLFALLLVISGADKIGDPTAANTAMREAGLVGKRRAWSAAGRALGAVEVVVGAAVLAFGGVVPALAMAAVFLGFGVFLVVLQRRAAGVSCGCFGSSSAPPGISHLVIDVAAAATGLVAAATGAPDLTAVLDEGVVSFATHVVLISVGAALLIAVSGVFEDVKNQREVLRSS
ncbi:MauE/DoxX family redox-associated membrane protein [Actinospongicola halichondriae]|uniref:MauE/DoxX family redox-associated membrane protein n=1 Tax=Actinospongicola halichondriae TaxID=3236844 RepID=UPI003D57C1DF